MNNAYNWYSTLLKPSWSPPSYLFGPVFSAKSGSALGGNFSFTYFQFGLNGSTSSPQGNNLLASIDILLVLATLIWALLAIYPHIKWIALANTPYLLWVTFATVLQITITWLNK